jgi:hypothetical protein
MMRSFRKKRPAAVAHAILFATKRFMHTKILVFNVGTLCAQASVALRRSTATPADAGGNYHDFRARAPKVTELLQIPGCHFARTRIGCFFYRH